MEPYISVNTSMRTAVKKEMDKDFHKLMNNAVYGKPFENQPKRTDVNLFNDRQKEAKLGNNLPYLDVRMFDVKIMGFELQKLKLLLTKLSYVGFAVLELSMLHIL